MTGGRSPHSGRPIGLTGRSPSRRIGVEHEYGLWSASAQIDFRRLLPAITADLRTLDPGDPRARRLPSGVMITADGREAELATPPLPWDGSAPGMLDALLAVERSALAAQAADVAGADLVTGFSTHVNVTVPDELVVEVGRRFVLHCGLATAVVGEPRSSPGLLVRPRRGRLEIGGEYAEGAHLIALVTFVGSAVAALLDDVPPPRLPEPVAVLARERFGWFLPPEGAYADLLDRGAAAGGELLDAVWAWARPFCVRDGVDPAPIDRLVAGAPLRLEDHTTSPGLCTIRPEAGGSALSTEVDTGPRLLAGDVEAETLWLTWQYVVWVFRGFRREVHAVVPVDQEADFLARLDAGEYDEVVHRELTRRAGRRRRLMVNAQLEGAGWWHEVRPGALVPAERGPDGLVPRVSYRRAARQHRATRRGSA